ncbi:hypothetical protein CLV47_104127 [Antricoccus suffuscus]|uniref:KANL3/Tex30 alpha/beta hydrolase-like domain-containing protein n=1 Tax=Antricoccus suffuscus TaxID=1629062 RepID=A0A2T1A2E1_9ACTN|nr:alpha/beta family hydrolase [Antricoccus suffuscus]PRZ42780.1 hypothetical protein CLV47_104127 [Antricoccus suffuscus]
MNRRVIDIDTPTGPARAHVTRPPRAVGTLVLGHGAGGGIGASDLAAIADAVPLAGWAVVLVEMPWRVAGKKVATPPKTLDAGWLPIVASLMSGRGKLPRPLVVGGRSAGARVACRTAQEVGADGVLCLSFPLHPPGKPEKSRASELRLPLEAGLPLHVVQGARDPFGTPDDVRAELPDPSYVTAAAGTHSFGKHPTDVTAAVLAWLAGAF